MPISLKDLFPNLHSHSVEREQALEIIERLSEMSCLDEKSIADILKERDFRLKMGEISSKEKELSLKETELSQKSRDSNRPGQNPLVTAVWVAVLGLFGNFIVSQINARSQIALEKQKDESALILDAMKPDNLEDRCNNLLVLEGTNLVTENKRVETLCASTKAWNLFVGHSLPTSTAPTNGEPSPASKH